MVNLFAGHKNKYQKAFAIDNKRKILEIGCFPSQGFELVDEIDGVCEIAAHNYLFKDWGTYAGL